PLLRHPQLFDPDVGLLGEPVGGGSHRVGDGVGGEQPVASLGQAAGEHARRAAGLERGPVPPTGQRRDGEGVFALLVPPGLEAPRVFAGGVHRLEVLRRCAVHGTNTVSYGRAKRTSTCGGRIAASAGSGPSGRIWLRNAFTARAFAVRASPVSSMRRARFHGTCGSSGSAQCHIHTGNSTSTAPVCVQASAAALPTVSWSGCPSPRHVVKHHRPGTRYVHSSPTRTDSSMPPSGCCR